MRMNAKQLRVTKPTESELEKIERKPIYLVLDNVLDTYNIGSIFRLADAVAAKEVMLCGGSEYPPSSRIHKAAVGTEEWVPWEYSKSTLQLISKLKKQRIQIIAVEQSPLATSYKLLATRARFPCAIVVGHETDGVSKKALELSDLIVEFPMYGINKSF